MKGYCTHDNIFHKPRLAWNNRISPLTIRYIWHENTCEVPIAWRSSNLFNKVQVSLAPSVRKRWRNGVSNSASSRNLKGFFPGGFHWCEKKLIMSFHGNKAIYQYICSAEANVSGFFPLWIQDFLLFFVVGKSILPRKCMAEYVNNMLICLVCTMPLGTGTNEHMKTPICTWSPWRKVDFFRSKKNKYQEISF